MADNQVQVDPVEMLQQESAAADASQAPKESTIEEVLAGNPEQGAPEQQQDAQQKPGWIQKRIQEGADKKAAATVAKAVDDAVSKVTAQFESRMAALQERAIKSEAQELVASGDVKTIEIATELVRRRYGISPDDAAANNQPTKTNQPETTPSAMTDARAQVLAQQAKKLTTKGFDVMATFSTDSEVKQKVLSGEWDMYDVMEYMTANTGETGSVPPPVRKANGGNVSKVDVSQMTAEQLKRLDEAIANGKSFRV